MDLFFIRASSGISSCFMHDSQFILLNPYLFKRETVPQKKVRDCNSVKVYAR